MSQWGRHLAVAKRRDSFATVATTRRESEVTAQQRRNSATGRRVPAGACTVARRISRDLERILYVLRRAGLAAKPAGPARKGCA